MELGGVNRASAVTTSSVVNQQYAQIGESSAAPDLPPEQTVKAVSQAQPATIRVTEDAAVTLQRLDALRQVIDKRVSVDPKTRVLLFQAVRQRTGEVVQQTPTDVSLKLRAYLATANILGRVHDEPDEGQARA
jgi:uncharacterized FlaG/YvyC family protein